MRANAKMKEKLLRVVQMRKFNRTTIHCNLSLHNPSKTHIIKFALLELAPCQSILKLLCTYKETRRDKEHFCICLLLLKRFKIETTFLYFIVKSKNQVICYFPFYSKYSTFLCIPSLFSAATIV